MPTRSDHPYLLGESSKFHTTPMDPQQIVKMFTKIYDKLETPKTFDERLIKVEAMCELLESPTCDRIPPRNNRRNNTDNISNI